MTYRNATIAHGKITNEFCIAEYEAMILCFDADQFCILVNVVIIGIDGVSDLVF